MTDLIHIKNCPICDSAATTRVFTTIDKLKSNESFDIFECRTCTVRFTTPIPNLESSGKYYNSKDYISHNKEPKTILERIYNLVQRVTLSNKKNITEKKSGVVNGAILDIGCGTGAFLFKMQSSGWSVDGVEINKSARDVASEKIKKQILAPKEFFESSKTYEVITLWHSLEHLFDVHKYIKKIIESLNKNGSLVIALPNYESFDSKVFSSNWAAYDVPRHLYHFSFTALLNLFYKHGFDVSTCKQLPFDPFYISLLSEINSDKRNNYFKILYVGLVSFLNGLINAKKASSILYVLKRQQ